MTFDSIEEAKIWWEKNKRVLTYLYADENKYDMSTLAIRKYTVTYKTVEKLRSDF